MPDLARSRSISRREPLRLDTTERFDFQAIEYRRLFADSKASAFQHPVWLDAFYRHVAPAHDVTPVVITGRDAAGALRLVLPLLRKKETDMIEYASLGVTDYACPVLARDTTPEAQTMSQLHALLGGESGSRIGPVHSNHLPQWQALLGNRSRHLDFHAHAVHYGSPYPHWRRENLGRRRAAELDRKTRRLSSQGELRFETVGAGDIRTALYEARDFRSGRFQDDPLQAGHGLEFYADVAAAGLRSGLARTWRLSLDGNTMALVFGLIQNTCFSYILLACDYAAFARHSPGRLALDMAMSAWAAEGGQVFDFTIGDEPFKAGFGCVSAAMHEFRL